MGLLKNISIRVMNCMVLFLIVILIPGLPPKTTFPFKEFEVKAPRELKGALEPNNLLDGADHLLEGRVYGPECLVARHNEIYMGIHGGEVIKMTKEHLTHVVKLGQPCEEIFEEARCGRPLGMAFDTVGNNLIVADAYYGLWLVNLNGNGAKTLLVSPNQELPGAEINRKAKTFNGVAVAKNGDIFYTDSTSDFLIQDLVYALLANPSGRVFKYDRVKNESTVLIDELFFANGLALSPDEDFLVIAETGGLRLLKYHLKGAKAGQSETFVDGLPGAPDNLTPDEDGLWVPLITSFDSEHPAPMKMFSSFPALRLFFARMLNMFETPFKLITNLYPNKWTQRFSHFIGHGESVKLLQSTARTTIVRVDWSGNIVGSLHGSDKTVTGISHVLEFNEQLLLGSPFNRYVGRVKSPKPKKQQPTVKVQNVRYEEPVLEASVKKPTQTGTPQQAQKQPAAKTTTTTTTTTTARPTTTTTTTPRPTTTTTTTTTTRRPTTTTTTPKPASTTTTTAAPKTTAVPKTAPKPAAPKKPAPVKEDIPADTKPPKQEKLKVINKQGNHVEL